MIRHTVIFVLKHAHGSLQEKSFLRDALVLKEIPGVEKFERLRQVSEKNDYDFGLVRQSGRLRGLQRPPQARGVREGPLGTRSRAFPRD